MTQSEAKILDWTETRAGTSDLRPTTPSFDDHLLPCVPFVPCVVPLSTITPSYSSDPLMNPEISNRLARDTNGAVTSLTCDQSGRQLLPVIIEHSGLQKSSQRKSEQSSAFFTSAIYIFSQAARAGGVCAYDPTMYSTIDDSL